VQPSFAGFPPRPAAADPAGFPGQVMRPACCRKTIENQYDVVAAGASHFARILRRLTRLPLFAESGRRGVYHSKWPRKHRPALTADLNALDTRSPVGFRL